MKLIEQSDDRCAGLVMEMVPLLMNTIRHEMRRQRPAELSMPQFRTLRILQRHPDISLSQLAARLDLTLATTSKLIDVLEKHGLVLRACCADDRRKLLLSLTAQGSAALHDVWQATQGRLGEILATLTDEDRAAVERAMSALRTAMLTSGNIFEQ